MATNPLVAIDAIVTSGISGHAAVQALLAAGEIQLFDRVVDAREMGGDAPDLSRRLWVYPTASRTDLAFGSNLARFERRYGIGFGVGHLQVAALREIEWAVIRACRVMFDGLQANGLTPIEEPSPLQIESIVVTETDPQREPVADPQEWSDVCDVIVVAHAARSALV